MKQAILSINPTRGYSDDSMEAAQHFSEYLKIFAKMIAREVNKERAVFTNTENKRNDVKSGFVRSLKGQEKLTLSVNEVSKLLGLSRSATYELIRTAQIPSIKFGRKILVPRAKLEMMLSQCSE